MYRILLSLTLSAALLAPAPAQERDKDRDLLEGVLPVYRSPADVFSLGDHCPEKSACFGAHHQIIIEWARLYVALAETIRDEYGWPDQLTDLQRGNLKTVYGPRIDAFEEDIRIFQERYPLPTH